MIKNTFTQRGIAAADSGDFGPSVLVGPVIDTYLFVFETVCHGYLDP
jgi:hypothetical protein